MDKQSVGGSHRFKVTGQPFAGIVVATGDHDDVAALRESQCGGLTDPARCTRDDDHRPCDLIV